MAYDNPDDKHDRPITVWLSTKEKQEIEAVANLLGTQRGQLMRKYVMDGAKESLAMMSEQSEHRKRA